MHIDIEMPLSASDLRCMARLQLNAANLANASDDQVLRFIHRHSIVVSGWHTRCFCGHTITRTTTKRAKCSSCGEHLLFAISTKYSPLITKYIEEKWPRLLHIGASTGLMMDDTASIYRHTR